ncbi:MAG: lipopolysaccharide biosynthesis protein, partial [Sphingomonas sp.]
LTSVGITSIIKSTYLSHLLKARVSGLRLPLIWAALAAIVVGSCFTALPKRFEWAELLIGIPAIAACYLYILFRWAFGPEDRTLFGKLPKMDGASLPA